MQKQIDWLKSEEATRLLDKLKKEWESENREDEERELYEFVHRLKPHPADDEEHEADE